MFTGFTQDALDFLQDIRFNNNQTFYELNKERVERELREAESIYRNRKNIYNN